MAPKVAVPMPPRAKPPNLSVKSPVPNTSVMAATSRFLLSEKSTRLSTQILAPATAIRPNTTIETPPIDEKVSHAGWFDQSPEPGTLGPAILLGHIDSARYGPAIFYELGSLVPGDTVEVTRADDAYSTSVPEGSVISQSPSSGTLLPGETVTITVSKGPEMVAVPSVEGLSRSAATTKLEAAGFKVAVQTFLGGPLDEVRASRPSGGTAPKGSTVTILVV